MQKEFWRYFYQCKIEFSVYLHRNPVYLNIKTSKIASGEWRIPVLEVPVLIPRWVPMMLFFCVFKAKKINVRFLVSARINLGPPFNGFFFRIGKWPPLSRFLNPKTPKYALKWHILTLSILIVVTFSNFAKLEKPQIYLDSRYLGIFYEEIQ